MGRRKLLQPVIGVTLVILLLVGCGAPAATPEPPTPTPMPPTVTPTPEPPTVTPTPVPPTLAVSVVSKDGTTFEITDVHFEDYYRHSSGLRTYPFGLDHLPLYTNLTTVRVPFDAIKSIERGSGEGEFTDMRFTVTLFSGERLEGEIGRRTESSFLEASFRGQTTVQGYPSEFETDSASVVSIIFTRDQQGVILTTVNAGNGGTTNVSEPWCLMEAESSFYGTTPRDYLEFRIGDSTLQIPLTDIAAAVIGEEETTLTLRSGEELVGQIPDRSYLSGDTTVLGLPAYFYASLASDVSFVTFY